MRREYSSAAVMESERYSLRRANFRGAYSSFNMGAGEDLLIELLHLVDSAPNGSLIVVEEVEGGLHPEAARRLAEELQDIAWTKKLQIIVSTHSEHFIDAVPRQARLLLERWGDVHHVTPRPTTRLAAGEMSGYDRPEALILCEDHAARLVIEHALPAATRRRVRIVPIGSDSELADQAAFHFNAGGGERLLLMWDGDVTEADVRRWLRAASRRCADLAVRGNWTRLPGGGPPESWLIDLLGHADAIGCLADDLREDVAQMRAAVEELRTETDHHRIPTAFGQRYRLTAEQSLSLMLRAAARNPDYDLSPVIDATDAVLEGHVIQHPPLDPTGPQS